MAGEGKGSEGAPGLACAVESGAPRLVTRGPRLLSHPIRAWQAGLGAVTVRIGGKCCQWDEAGPGGTEESLCFSL